MFCIGICDDCFEDRRYLRKIVEKIMKETSREYQLYEYSSGENLYQDLVSNENMTIDLLFLDIEMNGMNGITLRDALIKNSQVWRIVFVSFHGESMSDAFGLKTVGFICKPAEYVSVKKKISLVLREYNENLFIELPSAQIKNCKYRIEQIAYFEADGNYSKIFLLDSNGTISRTELICCKLIDIEEKYNGSIFLRIHKSYLVNMMHIMEINDEVLLSDPSVQIPVGRKYKGPAKESYVKYALNIVKEKLL